MLNAISEEECAVVTFTHKRNNKDDGDILFPKLQCWNPDTRVATIVAEVSSGRIDCKVKLSDLSKLSDPGTEVPAIPDDPMQSVTDNREAIEKAARKLIENKQFEADGSILVQYKDLQ